MSDEHSRVVDLYSMEQLKLVLLQLIWIMSSSEHPWNNGRTLCVCGCNMGHPYENKTLWDTINQFRLIDSRTAITAL